MEKVGRRNPFQGGMGFFTTIAVVSPRPPKLPCRNPFQGGMGFFTGLQVLMFSMWAGKSQSLSGWDGVFHPNIGHF